MEGECTKLGDDDGRAALVIASSLLFFLLFSSIPYYTPPQPSSVPMVDDGMVTWQHIPLGGSKKRTFTIYAEIDHNADSGFLDISTHVAQQFPDGTLYCDKDGPMLEVRANHP